MPDAFQPLMGDAVSSPLVKERDDLVLQHAPERGCIGVVLIVLIEQVVSSPIFHPFFPSNASRHQPSMVLRWSPPWMIVFMPLVPLASIGRRGRVQPDVRSGNKIPRNIDIVVFEEHDPAEQIDTLRNIHDLLDVLFACVVARMRFSGKDQLDGTVLAR